MVNEQHYNPVIYKRLLALCQQTDSSELLIYLDALSHANFRTAGYILGERILPQVSMDLFWSLFYLLLDYHSKAFLVTLLKSVLVRRQLNQESLDMLLHHPGFLVVSNYLNSNGRSLDKKKILQKLIPEVETPALGEFLFERLHVTTAEARLEVLLRSSGLCAAYLLFQTLRELEHERTLLVRCCVFLMKKGDSLSFNLVSLFKLYFDLTEVKGCFSLRLNPYELGRMESSYEVFVKVMSDLT